MRAKYKYMESNREKLSALGGKELTEQNKEENETPPSRETKRCARGKCSLHQRLLPVLRAPSPLLVHRRGHKCQLSARVLNTSGA